MKKEELARAIFEERNRLKELKSEQPLDLNSPLAQRKMWELSKKPKTELEQELWKTQEYYDWFHDNYGEAEYIYEKLG